MKKLLTGFFLSLTFSFPGAAADKEDVQQAVSDFYTALNNGDFKTVEGYLLPEP